MQILLRVFLVILLTPASLLYSQNQDITDVVKRYFDQNSKTLNLSSSDYKDLLISSISTSDEGITYLYLNQSVDGIPLRNALDIQDCIANFARFTDPA